MNIIRLTKWQLWLRCGKGLSSVWTLITAVALIVHIVIGIVYHAGVWTLLALSVLMVLLLYLILLVVLLFGQWKGLFLLRRQEKLFGFCFAEEDLDQARLDDRWFISTDFYLLAFRRGFIIKAGTIRVLDSKSSSSTMTIMDCEGKKHRIRANYLELIELKKWLKSQEKP